MIHSSLLLYSLWVYRIDWLIKKSKSLSICCNFFLSQKRYFKKTVSWWQSHGIDIWPSSNNTTLPIIWRRSPFVGDATISGRNFAHSSVSLVMEFSWWWDQRSKIFGLQSTYIIQVDCFSLSDNWSKLGIIWENDTSKKLGYEKIIYQKMC